MRRGKVIAGPATVFVILLAVAPASAREIPFQVQTPITTSANAPRHLALADIDGDGDLDVLCASSTDDRIRWYENDGTPEVGAWPVTQITAAVNEVWRIFPVDMDRDGDIDVLAASRMDNKVAWHENLLGDGSTWSAWNITTTATYANSIFPADVNGDGYPDVFSSAATDNEVVWYENEGDPTGFWTKHTIQSSVLNPTAVFAADIDADGDPDLLSVSADDDRVRWHQNNGGPIWTNHIVSTAADGPVWVHAADVNGDGRIDAITASNADDKIAWFENDGTPDVGSWLEHTVALDATAAQFVSAADLDADGDIDLLSASNAGREVAWYENTAGDGSAWTATTIDNTMNGPRAVIAGDVDRDGDQDVLFVSVFDDTLSWYTNETIHRSAAFPVQMEISTSETGASSVLTADLDRDGDLDVVSTAEFDDRVAWYENTSGDGSTWSGQQIVSSSAGGAWAAHAADLDGDGDTDLLAAAYDDDKFTWYANDGTGSFGGEQIIASANGPRSIVTADVDLDGDLDVFTGSQDDDTIAWHRNENGSGTVWVADEFYLGANGARSVFAADFNGDGWIDVASASQNDDGIRWYDNDLSEFTFQLISNTADRPRGLFVADVDRDGDMDVLAAEYSDHELSWFENTNDGADWSGANSITFSAHNVRSVYAADVDQDGDLDAFAACSNTDKVTWYENLSGDGASWSAEKIVTTDVDDAFSVHVADVDGDGDLDVLSASWLDDTIAWYENRGGHLALETTDTAPIVLDQAGTDDLLKVVATHRGRAGDTDVELATLELFFESGAGVPLSEDAANALIENLYVYLDDGSNAFEAGSDTVVHTEATLDLSWDGVQTLTLADGLADLHVTHGTPRTYFVVVEFTADAAVQRPNRVRVTHLTESSSTIEDADHDIPLTLEYAPNVQSEATWSQAPGAPTVVKVRPWHNGLWTSRGANVYVVFSEPVNPGTVTTSNFLLRDVNGVPVAATVSPGPWFLQATLDPDAPLAPDTIYEVEVTSGVQDLTGTPAVPFTSLFETGPRAQSLPAVSEQATLPTTPLSAMKAGPEQGSTAPRLGLTVAPAGNLDGDDYDDFVAGAPGLEVEIDSILRPEAGAAAVYLGGGTLNERTQIDILFHGEATGDRAGAAVVGNFDFNQDGTPDLLIGAPGAGKVYLVRFVPGDYPAAFDGDPATYEKVNLNRVGVDIPGVVFTEAVPGELEGLALAAGGPVRRDALGNAPDILIGAPGREILGDAQAGVAYVIFNNPSISGTRSLALVGGSIDGIVFYEGDPNAYDHLGQSVAFVGDVTGDFHPDLALGAPEADPAARSDAGMVYVVPGGALEKDTLLDLSTIDGVVKILGGQAGEQLGYALAGGGDNLVDATLPRDDLLIGAPSFSADTGRVVQLSHQLQPGDLEPGDVGSPGYHGVIWTGAAPGERLGQSLAVVGDVTDNDWDDIVLGAPSSDDGGATGAGVVYLVEGESTPQPVSRNVIDVGSEYAGMRLDGVGMDDHAGWALSGVGDVNDDDKIDFLVGAPDRDVGGEIDAGTVYMVLDSDLGDPGNCDEDGCTVADVSNGAQIFVPQNTLQESTHIIVKGILDDSSMTEGCDETYYPAEILAGAADYTENPDVAFHGSDPTAHIPVHPDFMGQLQASEDVWYCVPYVDWFRLCELCGLQDTNPHYDGQEAIKVEPDEFYLLGVFFNDRDGDLRRDPQDCAPDEGTVFETPHEIENVEFPDRTHLEWDSDAVNSGIGTAYDVLRGALSELADLGTGPSETCVDTATGTSQEDTTEPDAGEAFFYLVRGTNLCGDGTYGYATGPAERTSPACP